MGIYRDQPQRVAAWQATCADCRAEVDEGKRDASEVSQSEGDCGDCGLPCCESHGRNYRSGWQHESCHEAIDYSHDGSY